MRIAFAGNPNSGKTTMYNALTGKNERVGNWAGVTIGRKESPIKADYANTTEELMAVDLPGAYSMSPFTPEESITSGYVRDEHPDAIINIVDATNLSRSLFFTTQLLELGIPVVVALNKSDINEKQHTQIDVDKLSEKLGCPVIKTVSTDNKGLQDVVKAAVAENGKGQKAPYLQAEIDLHDKEAVDAEDRKRFAFVNKIVSEVEQREVHTNERNTQDKIDAVITNKFVGIVIFAVVMWAVFWISQSKLGPWIADYLTGWIGSFQEYVSGLLEDCGYMARVSVVMDPIFKRVGLSGKSIIPIIIGTGCGIPGIMASRTIRDDRERRATAMLTTFMPCGAKIPVIALFAGAFFAGSSWVGPVMYFVGILLIFLGALLIKWITGYKYRKSFFIMELPNYKLPSLKRACFSMLERAKAYIKKAATIILVCNCVVQLMQTFNWHFQVVAEGAEDTSILATIASPFAVLLIPLGFGAWQLAAAAITGFIAKENVVGTLAVVYSITNFIDTDELALTGGANQVAMTMGLTTVTALAYLMFNLYTPPCFAAIGAMNSEMKSAKWLWGAIGLQLGTGYTVAFLVYHVGSLITGAGIGTGFVPGLIAILCMVAIVIFIAKRSRQEFDEEYELHSKGTGASA